MVHLNASCPLHGLRPGAIAPVDGIAEDTGLIDLTHIAGCEGDVINATVSAAGTFGAQQHRAVELDDRIRCGIATCGSDRRFILINASDGNAKSDRGVGFGHADDANPPEFMIGWPELRDAGLGRGAVGRCISVLDSNIDGVGRTAGPRSVSHRQTKCKRFLGFGRLVRCGERRLGAARIAEGHRRTLDLGP